MLSAVAMRSFVFWLMALACAPAISGCSPFDSLPKLKHTTKKLPALNVPPDAVQLEIVFVERPAGDALLGSELWRQVDQVAALEQPTRTTLQQNGFRVGVVGSHPPAALQAMLGLKADFVYEPDAEKAKQLVGRQVMVRSGGTTEIQVSPNYEECTASIHHGEQVRERSFKNARCLYHVTVERVQDGWVRLDFVPQVKHGDEHLRHRAADAGWLLTNTQDAEMFYPQRFSVNLSVGEMAVLSAEENVPSTLGHLFFLGAAEEAPVQRLVVVRLADMRNAMEPYGSGR